MRPIDTSAWIDWLIRALPNSRDAGPERRPGRGTALNLRGMRSGERRRVGIRY